MMYNNGYIFYEYWFIIKIKTLYFKIQINLTNMDEHCWLNKGYSVISTIVNKL